MRLDHDGIALWYGTSDAPAPAAIVDDDANLALTIGVQPPDASNAVEVRYRIDGGPMQVVRAAWARTSADRTAQYFRASFPRLKPGERVEYTPVCRRAGRQAPSPDDADRLVSVFTMAGDAGYVVAGASSATAVAASPPRRPSPPRLPGGGMAALVNRPPGSATATRLPAGPRPDDDDKPEDEVTFAVQITSPKNGSARQPGKFEITGTTTKSANVTVMGVQVTINDGVPKSATETGPGWKKWSLAANVATPGQVKIVARVWVKVPGGTGSADSPVTKVELDNQAPTLAITGVSPGSTVEGAGPAFPITISGTAKDEDSVVQSVVATVDSSGETFAATTSDNWSHWNCAVTLRGDTTHTVTVTATDQAGNAISKSTQVIARDTAPPAIAITEPSALPDTVDSAQIEVIGTAQDGTGVKAVMWRLDTGDFKPASKLTDDWSQWRARITVPGPGQHTVSFKAIDAAQKENQTPLLQWTFTVPELGDLQDTSLTAYLRDLLLFVSTRVVDAGRSPAVPIDAGDLEQAFFHPFNRLGDGDAGDGASRRVSHARIAVEVLRRFLKSKGAAEESRYREAVYHNLLQSLGTSYEEIRLVRGADQEARRDLAERLGVTLAAARPHDELDQLFLTPERLANPESEADLESLFGLVDTRRDPFADGPQPLLLTWKKRFVRVRWDEQDVPSGTPAARPIVDPDIVSKQELAGSPADNPAHALWQARSDWIANQLDGLRKKTTTTPPLKAFDQLAGSVLPAIDLEDLAAQHDSGADLSDKQLDLARVLDEQRLSLAGFLQLVRTRRLAAAGSVLEMEWEDAISILVQALKERKAEDWVEEEKGITLGPDHFAAPPDPAPAPGSEAPEPLRWRRSARARREFEQKLASRIRQDSALKDSLASGVAAAEEAALPLLRDALVNAVAAGDQGVDAADWTTRRLQLDVRTSGAQRTTRLELAIETLQGALFSLRTDRLAGLEEVGGPIPFADWALTTAGGYTEEKFDEEWRWLGSYEAWHAALFVFGYPENYLLPNLVPALEQTPAFRRLVETVQLNLRMTAQDARALATAYESDAGVDGSGKTPAQELASFIQTANSKLGSGVAPIDPAVFALTDRRSESQIRELRRCTGLLFTHGGFENMVQPPPVVGEVCYFVPILLALQLHKAGQFLAALNWFQCVYAYNLPLGERKIYRALVEEEGPDAPFVRPTHWLLDGLNPHVIARLQSPRANAYTRFTVFALVRCFLDFADAEFTTGTNEAVTRARTLYMAAAELLDDVSPAPAQASRTRRFRRTRCRRRCGCTRRSTCSSCATGATSPDSSARRASTLGCQGLRPWWARTGRSCSGRGSTARRRTGSRR